VAGNCSLGGSEFFVGNRVETVGDVLTRREDFAAIGVVGRGSLRGGGFHFLENG